LPDILINTDNKIKTSLKSIENQYGPSIVLLILKAAHART